ncbi:MULTISPECIES: phage GP46 family protein [Serratia]|uniref:phage GP46 family protein n=1 Tax=Serratia TaxID=613 RepID=UPI00066104A8|nr:phage GP46 family protein [Serratia sp. 506_PEND]
MADIAIVWQHGGGNLVLNGPDLLTDDSIETAVIISLFTDRRAAPSDVLPDGTGDQRGWWGDSFRTRPIGSRLWLLSREKTLDSVLTRAQAYAEEALAWMKSAGLVSAIRCEATQPTRGALLLAIRLTLPDGSVVPQAFEASLQGV